MNIEMERLNKCVTCVREKTNFTPKIAVVLGSGLGSFADHIRVECELSYHDIEDFPVSTVPGHEGKFIFGYVGQVPVVCMKGRVHYYEGYDMSDVVLPIRLMKLLGADTLLLTNAAGGVNPIFRAGDFMLIRDQIALFVPNPLVGENIEELGCRFPDMSQIYDQELQVIVRETAANCDIILQSGVYAQLSGPSYESPAEIRFLGKLGCDAVGMSTAVEAIAAKHMGMRVCGISCISNMAAGIQNVSLNHEEVQEMAGAKGPEFCKLLITAIQRMG